MGHSPWWVWGFEHGVNEHGVAIGNQTVFSNEPIEQTPGLIGMDLVRLALERGRDAREALEVIATLIETHGQGGAAFAPDAPGYHNSFLLADPQQSLAARDLEPALGGAAHAARLALEPLLPGRGLGDRLARSRGLRACGGLVARRRASRRGGGLPRPGDPGAHLRGALAAVARAAGGLARATRCRVDAADPARPPGGRLRLAARREHRGGALLHALRPQRAAALDDGEPGGAAPRRPQRALAGVDLLRHPLHGDLPAGLSGRNAALRARARRRGARRELGVVDLQATRRTRLRRIRSDSRRCCARAGRSSRTRSRRSARASSGARGNRRAWASATAPRSW